MAWHGIAGHFSLPLLLFLTNDSFNYLRQATGITDTLTFQPCMGVSLCPRFAFRRFEKIRGQSLAGLNKSTVYFAQ